MGCGEEVMDSLGNNFFGHLLNIDPQSMQLDGIASRGVFCGFSFASPKSDHCYNVHMLVLKNESL